MEINKEIKFYKSYQPIRVSEMLSLSEKIVLETLLQYWNEYKENTQLSINTISKESGISRRTVIYSLFKLEELKLISIINETNSDSSKSANKYIVNEKMINNFFQADIYIDHVETAKERQARKLKEYKERQNSYVH